MHRPPEITWITAGVPPAASVAAPEAAGAHDAAGPGGARCEARVRFPAGCAWFDGHFPDHPVLPGVALLALVRAVVARWRWPSAPAARRVTGFGRVRFRQPVGPDQPLRLTVSPSKRGEALRFVITKEAEQAGGDDDAPGAEPIVEGLARWAEAPGASDRPDTPHTDDDPSLSGAAWRWA